jgi:hypothetical protein
MVLRNFTDMDITVMQRSHDIVCVTPADINPTVQELLTLMAVESVPMFVKVVVEPYATPKSCYFNVADKVARDGCKNAFWLGYLAIKPFVRGRTSRSLGG